MSTAPASIGVPRRPDRPGKPGSRAARQRIADRSMTLDAIRGALVILMVFYHAAYIAVLAGLANLELHQGFWWFFPRSIAAGFLAVSGWSLAGKKAKCSVFREFLVRAGRLAIPAMAITVISGIMFGRGFVFFGILHLLAVSSILSWPLLGRPVLALATGCAVMVGGLLLGGLRFDWPYLAWLGLRPAGLYPVDYLPLLPWFAWCLFGAATRDLVFPWWHEGHSPGKPWLVAILRPVAWSGRHSLAIYLVHLPALYGLARLIALLSRS